MAHLIADKTICPLCGKTISSDDVVVGFPAFLKPSHRLGLFSDGIFHQACVDLSSEGAEAQALYTQWLAVWQSRPSNLESLEDIDEWGKNAFAHYWQEVARADS
ncbi:hypothetical protein [Hyphomonas oceanitis]